MYKEINECCKIICDYQDSYIDLECDGFVYNSFEFSNYPGFVIKSNELLIKINQVNNKLRILNIDRIISETEINDIEIYLEKFYNYFDYFIYSDYSIYVLFKIHNYDVNKLIYDSKTMVCSDKEVSCLDTKTFLSQELSYEEINHILQTAQPKKVSINVFGLHQIMYSKRPLLSFYNINNANRGILKQNVLYDLKESQRNEMYKIIEKEHGTYIYTPYFYYFKSPLNIIKSKVAFLRIECPLISKDNLKLIIDYYKAFLSEDEIDNKLDLNDILEINNLNNNLCLNEGFLKDKLYLLKK